MSISGRPRRIGLVAPYFPPHIGGANIYCHELAKAIAEKGHEVHVFAHPEARGEGAYTLHPILKLDLDQDLAQLAVFDMDVWHSLFFFYAPLALAQHNVFVTGFGDDFYSFRVRRMLPGRALLGRYLLWRLSDQDVSGLANIEPIRTTRLNIALQLRYWWHRRTAREAQ